LLSIHICLAMVIPFLVVITFNLATIMALCRNSFRHTMSGNRDHILVFTKITIMTGVSFVMAFSLELYYGINIIFDLKLDIIYLNYALSYLSPAMLNFNSCMNPIICLVVCKSMHDDIKSILMAVIRRVRRPCASRCWPIQMLAPGIGDRKYNSDCINNLKHLYRGTLTCFS